MSDPRVDLTSKNTVSDVVSAVASDLAISLSSFTICFCASTAVMAVLLVLLKFSPSESLPEPISISPPLPPPGLLPVA